MNSGEVFETAHQHRVKAFDADVIQRHSVLGLWLYKSEPDLNVWWEMIV